MQTNQTPQLQVEWIDPHAMEIVRILQKNGFNTYLVGGCVRDLLVGIHPKDFDIVTDARPNDVRKLIHRAYVIGKRFRLVLVQRESLQFEVATFRRNLMPGEELGEESRGPDNLFGSPKEDANRRDFTINGLFFDPIRIKLIDHCEGLPDIKARTVRMIGDPNERLKEDPIRILRGLRLAHKLGFSIEPRLREACLRQAPELKNTALPRRREEILKLLRLEDPARAFHEAHDLGIWASICPALDKVFNDAERMKEFDSYFHRIHDGIIDPSVPVQLFGFLFLAYFRSMRELPPEPSIRMTEILEDPELKSLMHEELGLFRYEQQLVAKALQFQSILSKTERFKKMGERRRLALLSHEAFPLALIMAQADYSLSPSQLFFWIEQRTLFSTDIRNLEQIQKKKGRRRRKPRKGTDGKTPQDQLSNRKEKV